jgi:hypothetical protein
MHNMPDTLSNGPGNFRPVALGTACMKKKYPLPGRVFPAWNGISEKSQINKYSNKS